MTSRTTSADSLGAGALAPGDSVVDGRYKILAALGEDRFGQLHRAVDTRLGPVVAVKVLNAEWSSRPETIAALRGQIGEIQRLGHRRVVAPADLLLEGKRYLLIEEWLQGANLLALLQARGSLPLAEAAPLLMQLAVGLDAVRALGLPSGEPRLTRIHLHFPEAPPDFQAPLSQPLSRWPKHTLKFNALAPDHENRRSYRAFFAATIYRLLGGNLPAGPVRTYIPLPSLSEPGNAALRQFLTKTPEANSAKEILTSICQAEGLPVPEEASSLGNTGQASAASSFPDLSDARQRLLEKQRRLEEERREYERLQLELARQEELEKERRALEKARLEQEQLTRAQEERLRREKEEIAAQWTELEQQRQALQAAESKQQEEEARQRQVFAEKLARLESEFEEKKQRQEEQVRSELAKLEAARQARWEEERQQAADLERERQRLDDLRAKFETAQARMAKEAEERQLVGQWDSQARERELAEERRRLAEDRLALQRDYAAYEARERASQERVEELRGQEQLIERRLAERRRQQEAEADAFERRRQALEVSGEAEPEVLSEAPTIVVPKRTAPATPLAEVAAPKLSPPASRPKRKIGVKLGLAAALLAAAGIGIVVSQKSGRNSGDDVAVSPETADDPKPPPPTPDPLKERLAEADRLLEAGQWLTLIKGLDNYERDFPGERGQPLRERVERAAGRLFEGSPPSAAEILALPPNARARVGAALAGACVKGISTLSWASTSEQVQPVVALLETALKVRGGKFADAVNSVATKQVAAWEEAWAKSPGPLPPALAPLLATLTKGGVASPREPKPLANPALAKAREALAKGDFAGALQAVISAKSAVGADAWPGEFQPVIGQALDAIIGQFGEWEARDPANLLAVMALMPELPSDSHAELPALREMLDAAASVGQADFAAAIEKYGQIAGREGGRFRDLARLKVETLTSALHAALRAHYWFRLRKPTDVDVFVRCAEALEKQAGFESPWRSLFLAWMGSDLPRGKIDPAFQEAWKVSRGQSYEGWYWSGISDLLGGAKANDGARAANGVKTLEEFAAQPVDTRWAVETLLLLADLHGWPKAEPKASKSPETVRHLDYLLQQGLRVPEKMIADLRMEKAIQLKLAADKLASVRKALEYVERAIQLDPTNLDLERYRLATQLRLAEFLTKAEDRAKIWDQAAAQALAWLGSAEGPDKAAKIDVGLTVLNMLEFQKGRKPTAEERALVKARLEKPEGEGAAQASLAYWRAMWLWQELPRSKQVVGSKEMSEVRALVVKAARSGHEGARITCRKANWSF